MISFTKLGTHGRLGNQLFQIASTLGLADILKTKAVFPQWEYSEFLENAFPVGVCNGVIVKEKTFEYDEKLTREIAMAYRRNGYVDLFGYFQSYKYWGHCQPYIKNFLKWDAEIIKQQRRKFYKAFEKQTIAIHIRRGDYIDNPSYVTLPINYYITAMLDNFKNWEEYNILVFSDNISYCKVHFDCLPNVFFAEGNSDIEDLILMSECDNFILSNSSFSFWAAYLGEKKGTKIIRPKAYFSGNLKNNSTDDFWPHQWKEFDHSGKKINLTDVTFTIPVSFDHKDRQKNLELSVCMLQHNFDTHFIIGEQGGEYFRYMKQHADYMIWPEMKNFHRTKMLNDMAEHSNTPYIANWDADVIVTPMQIYMTVKKLREGADIVYPYKWMFARIPRLPWFSKLEKYMDIGIVGDTKFNGMNNGDAISYGGAVFFNKESFFKYGGENEKFISFGPEDSERHIRFKTVGAKLERVLGPIYHVNHYVGPNSSNKHPFVAANRQEHERILKMDKPTLLAYIKTWTHGRGAKK